MTEHELERSVRSDGFAFVHAPQMRTLLTNEGGNSLEDWTQFADSWNDMPLDEHMADGGRYRRRRHAVLSAPPGSQAPHLEAPQPHYQSLDYNTLNGGVARWYEPIAPEIVNSGPMRAALAFGCRFFGRLRPDAAWKIELHQFRIEATAHGQGQPTPEGLHRDGVDCVLVLLVRRENVASATTSVHDLQRRSLGSFTLAEPLDAAIVDDARVMHGVTPVERLDLQRPASRDVLVATYRRA